MRIGNNITLMANTIFTSMATMYLQDSVQTTLKGSFKVSTSEDNTAKQSTTFVTINKGYGFGFEVQQWSESGASGIDEKFYLVSNTPGSVRASNF